MLDSPLELEADFDLRQLIADMRRMNGVGSHIPTSGGSLTGFRVDLDDLSIEVSKGGAWEKVTAGGGPTQLNLSSIGLEVDGSGRIVISRNVIMGGDLSVSGDVTLGSLSASRLVATDANKALASVADLTDWIGGTANQITVATDGAGGVTLSIPDPLYVTNLRITSLAGVPNELLKVDVDGDVLEAIEGADYAGIDFANIFLAAQKIDILGGSATAFVVEQDGVKDNVLVVDTLNGRVSTPLLAVGAGLTPDSTHILRVSNAALNTFISVGQDATHNYEMGWAYNVVAANAVGRLATYDYANAFQIDASVLYLQSLSLGAVSVGGAMTITGLLTINGGIGPVKVGDAITPTTTKLLGVGNTAANTYLGIGQSASRNYELGWIYNATVGNAYGQLVTYGYSNDFYINVKTLVLQNASAGKVGIGTTGPATLLELQELVTLAASPADGYAAALTLDPGYTAAYTVTRHNYIDVQDVSVAASAVVTDSAVLRFDAAIATHKALAGAFQTTDSGSDTTSWAGGIKVNVAGTLYKIPLIAA